MSENASTCPECGVEFDGEAGLCPVCAGDAQEAPKPPLGLTPGVYESIPEEEYHSDVCSTPSLSSSIAKTLVLWSPAKAWLEHPRLGGKPRKPTKEMDHGTLMHSLLLGRGRDVVLVEHDDWRTKDAKAQRQAAWEAGATPVLAHRLREAHEAVKAIREELSLEYGYELNGQSELTIVWEEKADDGTTVLCRCRIDHWLRSRATILDLKCGADARPETCERQMSSMGYEIQGVANMRAIESAFPELLGRVKFLDVFCEVNEPYAVTPVELAGSLKSVGEMRWRRAVNLWARCLRENKWPKKYVDAPLRAEAKPWVLEREMENSYGTSDAL